MPLPDIDLGHAIGLAPRDAIAYFEQKGYQVPPDWRWWETDAQTHAQAFTVAKAARADVLEAVRTGLRQAFGGLDAMPDGRGISEAEFIRRLTPELQRLGWWGKQIVVDPDGGAEVVQLGSPWRLKHIYRANVQAAYNAGRYKQQLANADARPWWMRIEVMDSRTRPSHRALHGRVYRYDDPFWEHFYPPDDHGCRGRVRTLSDRQMEREGISPSSSEGRLGTQEVEVGVDPRTGEVVTREVPTIRVPGQDGRDILHVPAWGWEGNAGARVFGTDRAVAQKLSLLEDQGILTQAVQALNNSEVRRAAFARWLETALSDRRPGHDVQAIGWIDAEASAFARAQGSADPVRVVALSHKHLVHADRLAHQAGGIALTPEEYGMLPDVLAAPDAIYWDTEHQTLVYVRERPGGEAIYLPVRPSYRLKKVGPADAVANAYRIPASRLADPGRYIRM